MSCRWLWALERSADPRTVKLPFSTSTIQGTCFCASRLQLAVGAQSCAWTLLACLVAEWGRVNPLFLLPDSGDFVS